MRPWQIRREEKAKSEANRDAMIMLAQAKRDVELIESGQAKLVPRCIQSAMSVDLTSQASGLECSDAQKKNRLLQSELVDAVQDAANINAAYSTIKVAKMIIQAADNIDRDERKRSSDETLQYDWFSKWRSYASSVRSEELQDLWSRILSEEALSPGQCSLRTLQFFSNISKEDAHIISKLASIQSQGFVYFDIKPKLPSFAFSDITGSEITGSVLGRREIDLLIEIGILGNTLGGFTRTFRISNESGAVILFDKNAIFLESTSQSPVEIKASFYKLTTLGIEVIRYGEFKDSVTYLETLTKSFSSIPGVTASYGPYYTNFNGTISKSFGTD
ncbi:MAG: DUF2806 domain-containing protein [Geminicoccaceae bacterium]